MQAKRAARDQSRGVSRLPPRGRTGGATLRRVGLDNASAHLEHVLGSIPVVVYCCETASTLTTWVSDSIERVSGFAPASFIEQPDFWASRLHPDDRERVLREFAGIIASGAISVEYRWQCADGNYRWFFDQATVRYDRFGCAIETTGSWLDITERKQAELALRQAHEQLELQVGERTRELQRANEHLRVQVATVKQAEAAIAESEERFRSLCACSPIGIFTTDKGSRCTYTNAAWQRITGVSFAESLGERWRQWLHPDDLDGVIAEWAAAVGEGREFRREFRIRRPDGQVRWVRAGAAPMRADDGSLLGYVGTSEDITDRRQAGQELLRSRQALRALAARLHAAQEEERLRIAREIHDEFGQALTVLKLDLAWLKQRLSPEQAELALHADKMGRLIDKTVREVRRIGAALRPAVLDLGLGPALEWQAGEFERRCDIRCVLTMPALALSADRDRAVAVFRIVQEALTNVARHAQADTVTIDVIQDAGALQVTVRDNGVGITPEQSSRPTGLGLLGMSERAQQWGGELAINGEPGAGTTLSVRLPLGGGERPDSEPDPC
ncbi:MAG: PAS domain-containing protein [Deltaproteobacteria bacterium]|nr:PAS domain-containing protein [Deltaproteobacteria bacterium]